MEGGAAPRLADSFLDLGRNLVPASLARAALQSSLTSYSGNTTAMPEVGYREGTNTLGIISFCLAFGTALGSLGEAGRPLVAVFRSVL